MPLTVTDEKGEKHETVYGVPVLDWHKYVMKARGMLYAGNAGYQKSDVGLMGYAPIYCEDPDCHRLHRGYIRPAQLIITSELDPLRGPVITDIERGHPRERGALVCEDCAAMAMAKRLIDHATVAVAADKKPQANGGDDK